MRIQNSLKNMIFGLTGQIISSIMGFIVRSVFIATLGIEYLGVSGLFSNILTMLSLANLGFDTAIIYSLYKPLVENDKEKIQALMNLCKKAYRIIGIVILGVGLSLLPFLSYIMNGETTIHNISLIYVLFLLNSVASYYFVYKQSIIIADQHKYIISKIHSVFTILSNLIQIVMLVWSKNYIIVLSTQIIIKLIENGYIASKANKLYPYINEKSDSKLSKEDKNGFFKNLYSLMLYKISGVVINGTDNIVISKFIGVIWVGIYSNYFLIITTLNTFLSYIFYSLTASVGDLNVKENEEKKYLVFRVIKFSNFWIYGFCSVCLWCLVNPFITLWLGKEYLMSKFIVFTMVLNFYTTGMQNACTTFRETTGLFRKGKYRPIIAAVINIIVSITLAQSIGIAGVLLGTVISRLCTYFWYDPYVIFKYVFHKPVKIYFIRYIWFGVVVFISTILSDIVGSMVYSNTVINLAVKGIVCIIIPNVIFLIAFRKSEELKYLLNIVKPILNKVQSKVLGKML